MARKLILTPFNASAIYALGETAGWHVRLGPDHRASTKTYYYALKKNNFEVIDSGWINVSRPTRIEVVMHEPATIFVELGLMDDEEFTVAGAAVAPHLIQPSATEPEDFDRFWALKIAQLRLVPADPVITTKASGRAEIDYGTLHMNLLDGRSVHGQVAKPRGADGLPGFVYFQWAGGPYPLRKAWVTDRAAEGFLALNIQPHDVLPDAPQEYYDALPEEVKNYHSVGREDRDESYYLGMYLATHRAVDYIVNHPNWDRRTLVVMGTSMGGMQALWAAALHPSVTAVIAHVPAGADSNGPLHGRAAAYPFTCADTPQSYRTSLYFDIVNCAPRIRVPTLLSIGFVDEVAPPAGLWTVFNRLGGRKEVVPLIDAAHNHEATIEQQAPFDRRAEAWLAALARGQDPISAQRMNASIWADALDAGTRVALGNREQEIS